MITFGLINVIGIVWYSNMLSAVTLACGVTACIAGFGLGIVNIKKEIKIYFGSLALTTLCIAGLLASLIRIVEDTNIFQDLWGAIPHILYLVLFLPLL